MGGPASPSHPTPHPPLGRALYSTIQFSNAIFAVMVNSFLSNAQYLFQDLFIVFILSLTLGGTPAAAHLTFKRPSGRLLSPYNLTLCALFVLATIAAQGAVYNVVLQESWYGTPAYPSTDGTDLNSAVPVTSSLFLLASYQYVACAIIFSFGAPWKRGVWLNRPFSGWLTLVIAVSLWLQLDPLPNVYALLGIMPMPYKWQLSLLGWGAFSMLMYGAVMLCLVRSRRAGLFSRGGVLGRCCGGAPEKPHARLRKEWAKLMSGKAVVSGGSSSSSGSGAPLVTPWDKTDKSVNTPSVEVVVSNPISGRSWEEGEGVLLSLPNAQPGGRWSPLASN